MAHLQVFPFPSGNKEKQREKEKERGQEKAAAAELSQLSSALGERVLTLTAPTTFSLSTPALASWF